MNASIQVDFGKKTGKRVMPLHGFNAGPMTKVFTYDARPWFVEGGFPLVRLHDVEYPYGSGEFVDIPCIFKNFDADENDPASYNFAQTDEYIRQTLAVGAKILYRLGVSIEHAPTKRYTYPPSDYGKWARICEHIIRHYNEGWADGYHWNIEYWEIWNEADLNKASTWGGTPEELYELYCVSATHLKSCFPNLKIGGCGWAGTTGEYIQNFFRYINQKPERIPLDFHSWHAYRSTADDFVTRANNVRDMLRQHGYGDVETILDEWNLMLAWDRASQVATYPMMKDHRGAAFYASVLCALQEKTDLAAATNFEADVVKEFCGIFDVDEMCVGGLAKGGKMASLKPTKGFYAFKSFNSLYRLGEQVELTCSDPALSTTAAAGAEGVGMMVSNERDESITVTLNLRGVRGDMVLRLTDAQHTNEKLLTLSGNAEQTLTLPLPPHAFVYLGADLPDPIPTYDVI